MESLGNKPGLTFFVRKNLQVDGLIQSGPAPSHFGARVRPRSVLVALIGRTHEEGPRKPIPSHYEVITQNSCEAADPKAP